MNDLLRLTYADIKTVKTRSVYQLVLEGPIEGMQDAFALLGAPLPGNEVWVAVARLRDPGAAIEPEALPAPRKGSLAQQAGILCNDPAFRRYLAETDDYNQFQLLDLDMAADEVRKICGVKSRAEIDTDPEAARKFRDLRSDFKLWLNGVAA